VEKGFVHTGADVLAIQQRSQALHCGPAIAHGTNSLNDPSMFQSAQRTIPSLRRTLREFALSVKLWYNNNERSLCQPFDKLRTQPFDKLRTQPFDRVYPERSLS